MKMSMWIYWIILQNNHSLSSRESELTAQQKDLQREWLENNQEMM